MIIVSAADERFVPHFATLLHSGWFHNRLAEFYLLDCGITNQTKAILEAFAARHGMRLTIVAVDTALFGDLPIHRVDLTAATFARLTLTSVFSETCEKVIFLDSDCVVTGSLSALWAIDLGDDLIAGVQDERALREDGRDGILRDDSTYINSGVMLVNLRAWRRENFGEEVISYLRRHVLRSHEQSAINIVGGGSNKDPSRDLEPHAPYDGGQATWVDQAAHRPLHGQHEAMVSLRCPAGLRVSLSPQLDAFSAGSTSAALPIPAARDHEPYRLAPEILAKADDSSTQ